MKVLKFGGSSVGSAKSIEQVLQIVSEENKMTDPPPIVVLSAMGGVTSLLESMAEKAVCKEDYILDLSELETKHFAVVRQLLSSQAQNPVLSQLKIWFNELEDILQAVNQLGELSLQTKDKILAYGERCAAFMISQIAAQKIPEADFVDAVHYVKTDSVFGSASVDMTATQILIRDLRSTYPEKLFFVTGFIASNNQGQITTLGRGGSDYTASIFGAALNVEEIQIWTDVNGMMTADPRVVKKAFSLKELSYTEAMEMSYFGAKVIYPPTMTQAFLKNIPIRIKNTFQPEFEGTLIKNNHENSRLPIKGISTIDHVSMIRLFGSGMVGKSGFSGRLFAMLSRQRINVILITQASSEHSICFAVKPEEAPQTLELIKQEFELELHAKLLRAPVVESDLSVMAIVGENMRQTPGVSGRLFHSLGRDNINVRAIAQGASELNISVIIAKNDLIKAVNTVHNAFFTDLKRALNIFCLGTGQIGKTLFRQLGEQRPYLSANNNLEINVVGIANTRQMLFKTEGISLENWDNLLGNEGEKSDLNAFIRKMKAMDLPNCILVDNTASEAPISHYKSVFEHGISVATCNKKGNSAAYTQYETYKNVALKYGVNFYYETNVGAGLPIIRVLRDLMMSGDKVKKIEAILSGSISYIFNHFKAEKSFAKVVAEAQQLGFTEPDPREDLSGNDFVRKMLILARESGYSLESEDVEVENILSEACLKSSSVENFYELLKVNTDYFENLKKQANKQGKVLRYIGVLEQGKAQIGLRMVDETHPFYQLQGSDNIISFTTDRYRETPMVIKGPGAGAEVTAAGVFTDIINMGVREQNISILNLD